MLVAIDGPAGAGKSTVARGVARELGFTYLDSGAMYRCVGLLALSAPARDPAELARAARIDLTDGRTLLNGRDVSEQIRSAAVAQAASRVAQAASRVASDPGVRAALVSKQRAILADGDWVAEGRDIGTVVAPDAQLKVFLTASPQERAARRAAELDLDPAQVLAEQGERDARDVARQHSPLRPADGAVTIDTTRLDVEAVVERIAALARTSASG